MARAGPFRRKRSADPDRRQLDMAAATAWQALVDAHVRQAFQFVALMEGRIPFDEAISRYLDEMDVRDPMASSIRSRVLVALEAAPVQERSPEPPAAADADQVTEAADSADTEDREGIRRFRPAALIKDLGRRVRETEEVEQRVALAIARAEERIIGVHIDNALTFTTLRGQEGSLHDGVEDYITLMRVTGGRAQAVFQRTMARLADLHLPPDEPVPTGRRAT